MEKATTNTYKMTDSEFIEDIYNDIRLIENKIDTIMIIVVLTVIFMFAMSIGLAVLLK
jgi:hypothetical protein